MTVREIIKKILYWTLPAGLYDIIKGYNHSAIAFRLCRGRALLKLNERFRDIHKGERCFILCNGPSVNEQDILPLKDEVVFSVSRGYKHEDYDIISPMYHCTPQITYGITVTEEYVVEWFKEMDENLGDAELFLNYTEERLVREKKLFPDRKIHYVCFGRQFYPWEKKIIDITGFMPTPQSVPIQCIMIAMYMGFKEIYLLGTDLNQLQTGEYNYFFKRTGPIGNVDIVNEDGKVLVDYHVQLRATLNLWEQFMSLKTIAKNNGITIYNATRGGALDVFERVELEEVVRQGSGAEEKRIGGAN